MRLCRPPLRCRPSVDGEGGERRCTVIHTFGSTGQPRGVVVSHGNVTRLMAATQAWFGFDQDDVWTLFHSVAFDFSVWKCGERCYMAAA